MVSLFFSLLRNLMDVNRRRGHLLRRSLKHPKRILVTRMQHLGDVAVFLPVIHAMRRMFPNAEIYALSKHRTGYELLRRCPLLDGVLRSPKWSLFDKLRLWWWMWNNPVDLMVVSTQDWGRALWGVVGGARCIVGYRRVPLYGRWHRERLPFTLSLSPGDVRADEQETERNIRLLKMLTDSDVEFRRVEPAWWSDVEAENGANLLAESGLEAGNYICFVPVSKRPAKMWMEERWRELARRLVETYGVRIVVLGADTDTDVCGRIAAASGIADLSGKTGIGELLYVVSRAFAVVSVDTGVAHLANAFGKPLVVLFGPGEFPKWKPIGNPRAKVLGKDLDCAPCYNSTCPKGTVSLCMDAIGVSDVVDAFGEVVES